MGCCCSSRGHASLFDLDFDVLMFDTGFTENQLLGLKIRFDHLDQGNKGYLSAGDDLIAAIPDLAANPLGKRIVANMYKEGGGKTANPDDVDVRITFESFARSFAHLRPLKDAGGSDSTYSSVESVMKFLFDMFDVNDDGEITIHEIMSMLRVAGIDILLNSHCLCLIIGHIQFKFICVCHHRSRQFCRPPCCRRCRRSPRLRTRTL